MKIYNRRGFASSIVALSVGIAGVAAIIAKGFDVRLLLSTVFLLGAGGYYLPRSLSRKASKEDKFFEEDEWDVFVEMKAKSMSFRIVLSAVFVLLVISVLAYGFTRGQLWLAVSLLLGALSAFMWIIWIITWICCEKHY